MTDSIDPRIDPVLAEQGDNRNVIDKYKTWTIEAIVDDLQKTRHPLHIAVENWEKDLNLGTITRSANAFNVSGFHVVGEKKWNRRGAMATYRYIDVYHHDDVESLRKYADENNLQMVGIDNCESSVPIENQRLKPNTLMLFGNEGVGLTDEAKKACDAIYEITMYGSTRSLNSSVAAGIAMYHWKNTQD